jgi:hypothetical protein
MATTRTNKRIIERRNSLSSRFNEDERYRLKAFLLVVVGTVVTMATIAVARYFVELFIEWLLL